MYDDRPISVCVNPVGGAACPETAADLNAEEPVVAVTDPLALVVAGVEACPDVVIDPKLGDPELVVAG